MQMTKKMILTLLILLFFTTAAVANEKEITVELTVPDSTWTIAIDEVHQVGNELWVISYVSQNPDVIGAQVISTVQASVKITVPDLPLKNFIVGKTWAWENPEPYTFIPDLKQIAAELESGKQIYPAASGTGPGRS